MTRRQRIELLQALYHKELTMRYNVTDNKGQVIATYENLSEVKSFLKASYPADGYKLDNDAHAEATTVFDKDEKEIAQIRPALKPEDLQDE